MSILATMFATMSYFECSVGLSKGFYPALQHHKLFLTVFQLEKSKLFLNDCKQKFSNSTPYSWSSCNFACKQKKITKLLFF